MSLSLSRSCSLSHSCSHSHAHQNSTRMNLSLNLSISLFLSRCLNLSSSLDLSISLLYDLARSLYLCTSLAAICAIHQYQVVGRALPMEPDQHPKIYRMKLWATNEVRAKSKFWYVYVCIYICMYV